VDNEEIAWRSSARQGCNPEVTNVINVSIWNLNLLCVRKMHTLLMWLTQNFRICNAFATTAHLQLIAAYVENTD